MNILIMSTGSNVGGVEKSLIEFLQYLSNRGITIDLYLWREPGMLHDQIPANVNIKQTLLYPGSFRECLKRKQKIKSIIWYIAFRLTRIIGNELIAFSKFRGEYDIAISYCNYGYSPHYVIDKVKAGKKYLWYHHGSYEGSGRKKRIDGEYFAKYDKVIAVSRACEQMLLGHFPQLQGKTTVIHNLINEQDITEKSAQPVDESWIEQLDGCKIVTVGRLAPEKGQMLAIETARILKQKGFVFHWIFVGYGGDRERCEQLIAKYGLEDCCHLVGVKTNPYPYMKLADIYVQPSFVESEGITVLEALALKKFLIASDIPALSETLRQGDFGVLCELTPEAFFEKIIHYSNKDHQKQVVENLENRPSANMQNKKEINRLLGL